VGVLEGGEERPEVSPTLPRIEKGCCEEMSTVFPSIVRPAITSVGLSPLTDCL
jgi:hypothetical protein